MVLFWVSNSLLQSREQSYRNKAKGSFVVEKWFRQIHLGFCVLQEEEWNDQEQKTGRLSEVFSSPSLLCRLRALSWTSVCFLLAMAAESFCCWFFIWYISSVNVGFDQLSLVCIGAKIANFSLLVFTAVYLARRNLMLSWHFVVETCIFLSDVLHAFKFSIPYMVMILLHIC